MSNRVLIRNPFSNLSAFNCFACGAHHKHGLRMKFFREGERVVSDFEVREDLRGFSSILHGGIQSTLLDEIMWWSAFKHDDQDRLCLTQKINVHYRVPVHVGMKLKIVGWVSKDQGNRVYTKGEIRENEDVLVSADGTYFYPSLKLLARSLNLSMKDVPQELMKFFNPETQER